MEEKVVRKPVKKSIRKKVCIFCVEDKSAIDYKDVANLPESHRFFEYNPKINYPIKDAASHKVIDEYIKKNGNDYRFETGEHPIEALRDRTKDNVEVGFNPKAAKSTKFKQADITHEK